MKLYLRVLQWTDQELEFKKHSPQISLRYQQQALDRMCNNSVNPTSKI